VESSGRRFRPFLNRVQRIVKLVQPVITRRQADVSFRTGSDSFCKAVVVLRNRLVIVPLVLKHVSHRQPGTGKLRLVLREPARDRLGSGVVALCFGERQSVQLAPGRVRIRFGERGNALGGQVEFFHPEIISEKQFLNVRRTRRVFRRRLEMRPSCVLIALRAAIPAIASSPWDLSGFSLANSICNSSMTLGLSP
jgi:hypothetical protein